MRHTLRAAAVIALIALGGGGYWYFVHKGGTVEDLVALATGKGAPGGGAPAAPAGGGGPGAGGAGAGGAGGGMPVEAVTVRIGTVARTVTAVGTLLSDESVVIRPEVAGRIAEIDFREGERTAAGTVLFRLDDSVARATLAQAQASLAFSRSELQRAEELLRNNAGSVRTREQALSKLQADEATVQLAGAHLNRLTLKAPFDGVLGLRKVSIGDYVAAGEDLVNIEAIDTLKLDFRVPELYLAAVRPGQTLAVSVDALPGRSVEGTVYAIDPLVDVNGRAVVIRAAVPNTDHALRPGLFARVELTLTVNPEAVLVPEQAVVAVGSRQFIYKVVDGKAVQTPVTLGTRRSGEVEIVSGLAHGDVVVTGGQMKIRDGAPVRVMPPAGAPPGPQASAAGKAGG
ncbi:efflux RND transporter periplasmic adaptor subunit [Azospirillum halopraeferens]|uniref:efflux RND transporter periplasmic adaptor subunit n=1 Tax=Azospirillum halopraeferens TaxID=34010 RepID=UPI0003FE2391|nr:efflux RND transporter periplasmic adaptor subunit [Azospirillum halopraeferens]